MPIFEPPSTGGGGGTPAPGTLVFSYIAPFDEPSLTIPSLDLENDMEYLLEITTPFKAGASTSLSFNGEDPNLYPSREIEFDGGSIYQNPRSSITVARSTNAASLFTATITKIYDHGWVGHFKRSDAGGSQFMGSFSSRNIYSADSVLTEINIGVVPGTGHTIALPAGSVVIVRRAF